MQKGKTRRAAVRGPWQGRSCTVAKEHVQRRMRCCKGSLAVAHAEGHGAACGGARGGARSGVRHLMQRCKGSLALAHVEVQDTECSGGKATHDLGCTSASDGARTDMRCNQLHGETCVETQGCPWVVGTRLALQKRKTRVYRGSPALAPSCNKTH